MNNKTKNFLYSLFGGSAVLFLWAYLMQTKIESNLSFWDIFDLPFESEAEDLQEQKDAKIIDASSVVAKNNSNEKPIVISNNNQPTINPSTTTPIVPASTPTPKKLGPYKDGEYKASAPTPWGDMDIKVSIINGRWVKISFLKIPNSPPSQYAAAFLPKQALVAQNSQIDGVSGATYTADAFIEDLDQIIRVAKN